MITYIKDIICGAVSLLKGMAVTIRYCLLPSITTQYPCQKLNMTARFRGLVDLRQEKCIMCYQCVKICPTACLSMAHVQGEDKKKSLVKFEYNMELCCFCGLCEQVCPSASLYLNKIYEIAVFDRSRLKINLLKGDKYAEWNNPPVK